ncbi:MAG: TIGR02757 family protein [Melioribacteraceae bacterium]|nr:TIGR02757 family protein [Melioribacteraceae bacterium]
MSKITPDDLKKKLDYHYRYFDKSKISPDPLEFLHRYNNYHDIEISGIISSIFAYGNIKQIMSTLEKIHSIMNHNPYEFVRKYKIEKGIEDFVRIKHRFYCSSDIANLFKGLNKIYSEYNSLQEFFKIEDSSSKFGIKNLIASFSKRIIELIIVNDSVSHGIKFMFPDPYKGSACKRMNLFLRWMVRKDELDFGLWNKIPASKLIIPVDTHIAKICKELKLTKLKNVSWKMAEEITENLKKFDPDDPVKYDFAICHIGMRGLEF